MIVCIPVETYQGLNSAVSGHFGSAPAFAVVDAKSMEVRSIDNRGPDREHGACVPLQAIARQQVQAVIVRGIGAGAIRRLRSSGIEAYRFLGGTVAEAMRQFNAGMLPTFPAEDVCSGHGGGHACHSHSHGPAHE